MGYDQYWLAVPELPQREWDLAVGDFARVSSVLHMKGLRLAGPDGTGRPVINGGIIAFNGEADCGHPGRKLPIAWPHQTATGIALAGGRRAVIRPPFAYMESRMCNGSCAAGAFVMTRRMPDDDYTKVHGRTGRIVVDGRRIRQPSVWVGKYFSKCRTSYKPYDFAVGCALLIAKRWFGTLMVVNTDGTNENWADVRDMCQRVLGYGRDMLFSGRRGRMVCARNARTPAAPDVSGRHIPVYAPDGDDVRLATAMAPPGAHVPAGGGGSGRGRGRGRGSGGIYGVEHGP